MRGTGEIRTKSQLRAENPTVSLPEVWNSETLNVLGVDPILQTPQPEASGPYKVVSPAGVGRNASGDFERLWVETDMFPEYTNEEGVVVTEAEQIAAYEAQRAADRRVTMACTPRQARLALASQGLYEAVQTTVVAISDEARIEWEYATTVERTSPLIDVMKSSLGMSDEDLDNLFELAVTL